MFSTAKSIINNRRMITVEEYTVMKRKLFALRCQYAKLLSALRNGEGTPARKRQARRLDKQISDLELQLALSDIAFPDKEPTHFRDVLINSKGTIINFVQKSKVFLATSREHILAKLNTSQRNMAS